MSECIVCYESNPSYVIQCGSVVPHIICDKCEATMRVKEPATREGRILRCPICRGKEKNPGKRTAYSYELELAHMYEKMPETYFVRQEVMRVAEHAGVPPVRQAPVQAMVQSPIPVMVRDAIVRESWASSVADVIAVQDRWGTIADSIRLLSRESQERYVRLYPNLRVYFPDIQPAPPAPPAERRRSVVSEYCESGNREAGICTTRSRTSRNCSYDGCDRLVCRSCRQCTNH